MNLDSSSLIVRMLKTRFSDIQEIVYRNSNEIFSAWHCYGFLDVPKKILYAEHHHYDSFLKLYFPQITISDTLSDFPDVQQQAEICLKNHTMASLFHNGTLIPENWVKLSEESRKEIERDVTNGNGIPSMEDIYKIMNMFINSSTISNEEILFEMLPHNPFRNINEDQMAAVLTNEDGGNLYEEFFDDKINKDPVLYFIYSYYFLLTEIRKNISDRNNPYWIGKDLTQQLSGHTKVKILSKNGETYLGKVPAPAEIFTPYGIPVSVIGSVIPGQRFVPYSEIIKIANGKTVFWQNSN